VISRTDIQYFMNTHSLEIKVSKNTVEKIKLEIEACAQLLPRINELPSDRFEQEFFYYLTRINEMSLQTAADKSSLLQFFFERCGEELKKGPAQMYCREKPRGYAGDFRTIDLIYTHRTEHSGDETWDRFFHRQAAPQAVRNRKSYFCNLYGFTTTTRPGFSLLNIACGPCRDVVEAVATHGCGEIIHNVDMDPDAIEYSKKLAEEAKPLNATIEWQQANAFMFRARRTYDLVWSAGLFDYLDTKAAARLLKRMWSWTHKGGKVVIGNFHPDNPSRNYMEWVGEWFLIHRTVEDMTEMSRLAGISAEALSFERDDTGVQLFMTALKN
jgi:SAM-dependent methyltransferase